MNSQKLCFCCYYAMNFNPIEAAKLAGFPNPQKDALMLLSDENVKSEIKNILDNFKFPSSSYIAYMGYKKLAFGSISDAVKLVCCDDYSQINFDELDLFNIAEIKRPKDCSMEIKFFDRLKALEKLQEIDNIENNVTSSFYEALNNNAPNIEDSSAYE